MIVPCDWCVAGLVGTAAGWCVVWSSKQSTILGPTDAQSLPRVRVFIVGRIRCTSVLSSWLRGVASSVTSGQVLLGSPPTVELAPGKRRACHVPPSSFFFSHSPRTSSSSFLLPPFLCVRRASFTPVPRSWGWGGEAQLLSMMWGTSRQLLLEKQRWGVHDYSLRRLWRLLCCVSRCWKCILPPSSAGLLSCA